jgi:hypothetical protein
MCGCFVSMHVNLLTWLKLGSSGLSIVKAVMNFGLKERRCSCEYLLEGRF